MRYSFYTADVFTRAPVSGNQLAVFPVVAGLALEIFPRLSVSFLNFPAKRRQ